MCSGFVSGKGGVANYCKDDNEASFYATGGGISSLTGRLLVFKKEPAALCQSELEPDSSLFLFLTREPGST
jgi:hypothetical protein